jgi:oligosaccharide repeat unit polymerase
MSPVATTSALLIFYLFLLIWLNKGNFLFSPAGVHFAYLALYIAVPAIVLSATGTMVLVGGAGAMYSIGTRCLEAIDLAIVGFAVGAVAAGRADQSPRQVRGFNDLEGEGFIFLLGLSAVLTLTFVASNFEAIRSLVSIQALFDPEHYLEVQAFKTEAMFGATYLLQGVNQIIPFVALFILAKSYAENSVKQRRFAVGLIVADAVFEIALGGLWVGFAAVLLAVLVRNYFRPYRAKQVLALAAALIIFVAGTLGLKHGLSAFESQKEAGSDIELMAIIGHRFSAGAGQLEFTLDTFPSRVPYEMGFTYLHDALAMIPSPIKRQFITPAYWGGFNGFMYEQLYREAGGTAQIPIMGEFYANFGLIGVVAGSILYGFCIQKASNALSVRGLVHLSSVVILVILGYRLAEATVEGAGDRFMVSLAWAAILFVGYSGIAIRFLSPLHTAGRTAEGTEQTDGTE